MTDQVEIKEPCPVCMAAEGQHCMDPQKWIENPDAPPVYLDFLHAERVQAYWFVHSVTAQLSGEKVTQAKITDQQILNTGLV